MKSNIADNIERVCTENEGEHTKATVKGMNAPDSVQSVMAKDEVQNTENEMKTKQKRQDELEPVFIRELTAIESGHNDSNPVWSPAGNMIAFERSIADRKEILITYPNGDLIQKIYHRPLDEKSGLEFFFPGITEEVSYNAGITWSGVSDRFVFMSNGGSGNYDLYLYELVSGTTTRLTDNPEKDGQAQWSPVADLLVFVSGRTGKADLYYMDMSTRKLKQLTQGKKSYLYPEWSPDGKKIAMIYGSNENHDIYIIDDVTKPFETLRALTTWPYDDLRPVWSPDGKKIAFYSNYNPDNDPKTWSLVVIASDGSDPIEGEGLEAKVITTDVIPDLESGPAWTPDSNRIIYVKNDRLAYNPIYIIDIAEKTNHFLRTGTKMNHDVSCSSNGMIAFRAQSEQWDHIFIAALGAEK